MSNHPNQGIGISYSVCVSLLFALVAAVLGGGIAFAPARVWADEVSVANGEKLAEAIEDAPTNGDERIITLSGDVTVNKQIKILGNRHIILTNDDKPVTLTSGHNGSTFWIENGATLTVRTSDGKNEGLVYGSLEQDVDCGPFAHVLESSSLTWESGTVSHVKTEVGALAQNQGSVTITGGLFSNNTATQTENKDGVAAGGAVVWSSEGSVAISGGKFLNNTAGTGGAIVSCERLTISGGTFSNNKATRTNGIRGGGAVYADNKMTISGGRFEKNLSYRNGGAVFLDFDSTATISGGIFTENACGYADLDHTKASTPQNNTGMGGAIYTEENTTTYMAWTAAYQNTAGHFGGGLWFCPSGVGETRSEGGIALFDNEAHVKHDPRKSGAEHEEAGNGTGAGDDFAIMWPTKGNQYDPRFTLSHAWYTGVSTKIYADGGTKAGKDAGANGFDDNRLAVDYGPKENGTGGYKRYADGSNENVLYTKAQVVPKEEGVGVGLKVIADPTDGDQAQAKEDAKEQAEVRVFNNHARLSGGGIGSNGNIVFSRFYKLTWSKVDADGSKPLGGSEWELTGPEGEESLTVPVADNEGQEDYVGPDIDKRSGYFCVVVGDTGAYALKETKAPDGYRLDEGVHEAMVDAKGTTFDFTFGPILNKSKYVLTWKKVDAESNEALAGSMWTLKEKMSDSVLTVVDNGNHDVDPKDGSFKVYVDDPGEYILREKKAPAGYSLNKTVYRATVNDTHKSAVFGVKGEDGSVGAIPNERAFMLTWEKADGTTGDYLPGSEWSLKLIGFSSESIMEVTDNIGQDDYEGLDEDKTPGKFSVSVKDAGRYLLRETKAPAGYELNRTGCQASVDASNPSAKFGPTDENGNVGAIPNERRTYSLFWTKVKSGTSDRLSGSWWYFKKAEDTDWQTVEDNVGQEDYDGLDENPAAGEFKVSVTVAGRYLLREKKAPTGYDKIDATFSANVSDSTPNAIFADAGQVTIGNVPSTIGKTYELIWSKIDGVTNNPLTGSEWLISGPNSLSIKVVDNGEGDEDKAAGSFKVTVGTAGEYALVETKAPDGYERADTEFKAKVSDESPSARFGAEVGIPNSQTPPPPTPDSPTIDIPIEKVWSDSDNQDGMRPTSVTVRLYANGVATDKTVTLNEKNGWKATFAGLDKTDESGKEIEYTVKEDPEVPGYEVAITGGASTGFTLTNTHTPTPPTDNPPDDDKPPTDDNNPPTDDNPPGKDNPPVEQPPEDTPPSDEPELPETGDQSLPTAVLASTAVAGIGLTALGVAAIRRRE